MENECNILKKRVDELEHEITRTEKELVVQCKEITDTSCQTDDTISEVSNRSELSNLSSIENDLECFYKGINGAIMLQGISDIHPILKRKRAVYWRRIDSRKVFIRSFVRSYY